VIEEIRELYAYDRWADDRLLEAAAGLAPEELTRDLRSSFPSILATLAHILSADWAWLERWQGRSPTEIPSEWDLSTLAGVRGEWEKVRDRRRDFLAELTDEDLTRIVSFRTLAGELFEGTLIRTLRHVVNHASYHRGQVVTLLRQLGATPPATDLALYYHKP
jgi:uncharacterized damage-inducible protein DinB